MRKPFKIDAFKPFYWEEITSSDGPALLYFFVDVKETKRQSLAREDRLDWRALARKERIKYDDEACSIMFTLRGIPLGIDRLLPAIAESYLPELVRMNHWPDDHGKGLRGRHIGLLWNGSHEELCGVAILDKTTNPNEAELSAWKHPDFTGLKFSNSLKKFMWWGHINAGYKDFIVHIEDKTPMQRGNINAILSARRLGFEYAGERTPKDPRGNGKTTVIMKAKDWHPR